MCAPLEPIPAAATVTATHSVDVDGDAALDVMTTFLLDSDWHLRVDFADGGGVDVVLADVSPLTGAVGIGGFDIEADGTAELFVKVDAGAYATLVGLFDYAGCRIVPITIDSLDDAFDGETAVFAVGASVSNFSALSCDGSMLWTSEGSVITGSDQFEVMDIPYTLEGHVLTQGFGDGAVVGADEIPSLFACGDLTLP